MWGEHLRTRGPDRVLHSVECTVLEDDAPVWRAVGEELGDQVLGRAAMLGGDLLDQATRDQPTHRMGDDDDPLVGAVDLLPDQVDQLQQTLGGGLDVESLCRHTLFDIGEQALKDTPMWGRAEGGGRLVVEPVDPDRFRRDAPRRPALQEGLLIAVHQQLVTVIDHQPQHWAFELVELRLVGSVDTDVGRAKVEAVERIIDGCVDPGRWAGVAADVDDRQLVDHRSSTRRDRAQHSPPPGRSPRCLPARRRHIAASHGSRGAG